MVLRTILFGAVLALIPAIGIVAIWYSGKQRRLERQAAEEVERQESK
jgi:hypothetical protein